MPEVASGTSPSESVGNDGIEIIRITDPQTLLDPAIIEQYRLDKLILEGYGYPPEEDALKQVAIEYDGASHVFLALNIDKKAIGSLGYFQLEWEGDAGSIFWNTLSAEDPELARAINNAGPVLYTKGIVKNTPEAGIGRKLTGRAFSDLGPALVLGETKEVSAVKTRSEFGPTYFDGFEVTEGIDGGPSTVHLSVQRAFLGVWPLLNSHGKEVDASIPRAPGVFFVETDYLLPSIPEPRGRLVQSFQPVIDAQKAVVAAGLDATAVTTLITDSRNLLRRQAA